ncbi:MAG TPA: DUF3631 domain-containing protein [Candidatus Acidoferrum sp.]|nr:DUF3631 domain-containing protein [Candidatus Acidoferrum sp.]
MKSGEESGSFDGQVEPETKNSGARPGSWIPQDWLVRLEEVEPWPEPVDGKALLDEIAQMVLRFVVLGEWAIEAVTLWVVHTYAFELRDVTTYLGIESPRHRCGKSTLLSALERLVNRAIRTSNISPSAFFRTIAETGPTLLVDEGDTFLNSEELKGILNSGYQRDGAFVMRVTHEVSSSEAAAGQNGSRRGGGGENGNGGPSRLVKFSVWCPKAIARIGRLPQTLADRCIVIRMQRKLSDERCERLKHLDGETLRRKCARFVRDHAEEIRNAQPVVPEGLNDRAADIWEPLLVLADLAGGDWPERARKAAVGLSASAQEHDPMGSLLMDILEVFLRLGLERVFSRTLAEWLNRADDRPWMALKKGKVVTGQWVAQQLQDFGIRPKTLRIGEERAKGYEMDDFADVFRRYIPRREWETFKAEVQEEAVRKREEEKAQKAAGNGSASDGAKGQQGEKGAGEAGERGTSST